MSSRSVLPGVRPAAATGVRRWLAAAAAALLAGCAGVPTMQGEVTRFHRWTAAEPLTFAFRREAAQVDSLEHRSYEALVRERLRALGFVEAEAAGARYRVGFDYGATPVPFRVVEYWPAWGWGPFGAWPGPLPHYRYRGVDPWFGVPPMPITRDTTVFRHVLRVDLFDERAPAPSERKVFESSAVAFAATESMPRLMPGLVAAALSDFPGESGTSRTVTVPLAVPGAVPAGPPPASSPPTPTPTR